jgi:hypothetical protein
MTFLLSRYWILIANSTPVALSLASQTFPNPPLSSSLISTKSSMVRDGASSTYSGGIDLFLSNGLAKVISLQLFS